MLSLFGRYWERAMFGLGVLGVVFAYGVGVGKFGWWPGLLLNRAFDAARDWRADWRHYTGLHSRYLTPTDASQGGVTIHDPERALEGFTFVTLWRDGGFGAELIDMAGETVHRWRYKLADVYPTLPPHLDALPTDWDANIQGSALFPDGDVLLNLYGGGTVRLDRCSNIKWVLARNAHHSIDLLPDGTFLVPVRGQPVEGDSGDKPFVGPGTNGFYETDHVLHVDGNGNVLREIDLLLTIHTSGFQGLLTAGAGPERLARAEDPLHHNDAEMLRPEMAAAFPMFAAGDILVSFRHINTIAVLDGASGAIKWSSTGQFYAQHDPDFLPNGHILIYDNRSVEGGRDSGRSRVIELDPMTQRIVHSYDGGSETSFYAKARGMADQLPNGNLLLVDPNYGRVLEVAPGTPDHIVWEYVNLAAPGEAALLVDAKRLLPGEVRFLGQSCP